MGAEGDGPSEDASSRRKKKVCCLVSGCLSHPLTTFCHAPSLHSATPLQTREERKVEQYVKMFSSLEAQQARPRRKEEEAEVGPGGRGKKKAGRLCTSLQWDDK